MPRSALRLSAGTLEIGAGPLAIEQQLTNCRIEWAENVNASNETVNFMDGTSDVDDTETTTHTATLSGNYQQDDLGVGSFIAYTWANRYETDGDEVPFTFTPNDTTTMKITGFIKLVPLTIGGDAKVKNRSDFTFRCYGEPALVAV